MTFAMRWFSASLTLSLCALGLGSAEDQPVKIDVHWEKVVRISETSPTLQVVVNPPLRRGTPVHDNA